MANHVNFEDFERYIREKVYPSEIGADKGKKETLGKLAILSPL